jgi:hypothetical protein
MEHAFAEAESNVQVKDAEPMPWIERQRVLWKADAE